MKYTPLFFQPSEFLCPCCHTGQPAALLVFFLDNVRRAWDAPIRVNSGHRCPRHNKEVGGAIQSRHLIGCAADIAPVHTELIEPFKYLLGHLTARLQGWEVKVYPRFVHVAVPRDEAARLWAGGVLTVNVR